MEDTSIVEIDKIFKAQKAFFKQGKTKELVFKKDALERLKQKILDSSAHIHEALTQDLGKDKDQIDQAEIAAVIGEIDFALAHLEQWQLPEEVNTPEALQPSKCFVYNEPYGVCYIIGPFNYPFNLTLIPLIGAIIGGNTAILKPSENTPCSSQVIADIVSSIFVPEHIAVVQGGKAVNEHILALQLDFIFFTGSSKVGKIVMEAASKQLIPVVLELGGKSPAIVLEDANLELAAEQLVFGRFFNSGQTCIAPDYILVAESIKPTLVEKLKEKTLQMYPEIFSTGKVISTTQIARLKSLLEQSQGQLVVGGNTDIENRHFQATVVADVTWDDSLMQEEIFGPILPVVSYQNLDDMINLINEKHYKPLAAYVFTHNHDAGLSVLGQIPSGDAQVNGVISHSMSPYLPFGGVGPSGIGCYHGQYNHSAFTYKRSIRVA